LAFAGIVSRQPRKPGLLTRQTTIAPVAHDPEIIEDCDTKFRKGAIYYSGRAALEYVWPGKRDVSKVQLPSGEEI
jgi:hypothetical protein